jgi:hypothetical protein
MHDPCLSMWGGEMQAAPPGICKAMYPRRFRKGSRQAPGGSLTESRCGRVWWAVHIGWLAQRFVIRFARRETVECGLFRLPAGPVHLTVGCPAPSRAQSIRRAEWQAHHTAAQLGIGRRSIKSREWPAGEPACWRASVTPLSDTPAPAAASPSPAMCPTPHARPVAARSPRSTPS